LTPPKTASDADDGRLSAFEIAALKLDADWATALGLGASLCRVDPLGSREERDGSGRKEDGPPEEGP